MHLFILLKSSTALMSHSVAGLNFVIILNRTLISGDKKAGFTVFWADDGLDTGPVLLQKECSVDPNDTVDSVYNRFLYPQGIRAMASSTLHYPLVIHVCI